MNPGASGGSGMSEKSSAGGGSGISEKSMSRSSSGSGAGGGGGGGGGRCWRGKVDRGGLEMVVMRDAARFVVSSEGGGGRAAARDVTIDARHKKHSPFPK